MHIIINENLHTVLFFTKCIYRHESISNTKKRQNWFDSNGSCYNWSLCIFGTSIIWNVSINGKLQKYKKTVEPNANVMDVYWLGRISWFYNWETITTNYFCFS